VRVSYQHPNEGNEDMTHDECGKPIRLVSSPEGPDYCTCLDDPGMAEPERHTMATCTVCGTHNGGHTGSCDNLPKGKQSKRYANV
jgi:hypothetical protein